VLINESPASGADLSIIQASASPEPVGIGMNFTYSTDALNEGPQDAAGVMLSDQLPSGTSFVSATPSQGSCSHANRTVTCNLGSLASAFDATVSLVVTPTATGTITNSVSVSGAQQDLAPANNSITQNTTVVPVFTLTAAIAGTGTGTVTSDLGGINCPGLCSTSLAMGLHLQWLEWRLLRLGRVHLNNGCQPKRNRHFRSHPRLLTLGRCGFTCVGCCRTLCYVNGHHQFGERL
jgi:uncharacterized repeat protein (TIGR01451 family)